MAELSVGQIKQLEAYMAQNKGVNREQAIQTLFSVSKTNYNKGLKLEHEDNNPVQPKSQKDIFFKSSEGKTYNVTKTFEKRINNVTNDIKKAEDENGFIGKAWSGFKNLTGIGDSSDKVREAQKQEYEFLKKLNSDSVDKIFMELTGKEYSTENLEKFINGEIQLKSENALQGYIEGQEMAVDVGADIVSGIAAVGIYSAAVAAAPFTGGASIVVGIAAAGASGAAIKTGLKAADAATGGRKYTSKDAGYDIATGAFSGVIAPITGGMGGAIGKTIATRVGVTAVKTVGKGLAEEVVGIGVKQGLKQGVKTALTNPTGYKYVGGSFINRATAYGVEMMTDGAVSGGLDNAFKATIDGKDAEEIVQAAGEGFVGGLILAPVVGGGMKGTGELGKYIAKFLPDHPTKPVVPENVIPKRTTTNLYPESDAAGLNAMKENLRTQAKGTESIEMQEVTGTHYKKTQEVEKIKEKFDFLLNGEKIIGEDVPVGEKYKILKTMDDNTYTIYKETRSGSNPGFWVEHAGSGDLYYFKTGNSEQNLTEFISSQLYKAAGIDIPDVNLVGGPEFKGMGSQGLWIKSKAIVGLEPIRKNPKAAYEGFAVDAWLANWDAVCSGNTLLKDGKAVRLDFGGSLDFRARGGKKQFGNQVPELHTFLDPNINPEAAGMFAKMTREDLIESLKRVQSVTNDDIQELYHQVMHHINNPEIYTAIKNRKQYLNWILQEAEKTPQKPEQIIQEYIKQIEDIVNKKYKVQIDDANHQTEVRSRAMKEMKEQRERVLNDEELAVLWSYKGNSYTQNTDLQYGKYFVESIEQLDKALDKTELTEDLILYRGDHFIIDSHLNARYWADCPEYNKKYLFQQDRDDLPMGEIIKKIYKPGVVIEEQQFVSTTISPEVANNFGKSESDIMYIFHAPKGTKGTNVEQLGVSGRVSGINEHYYDLSEGGSEAEVLLKRGFKYIMTKCEFKDGHYVITCQILPDAPQKEILPVGYKSIDNQRIDYFGVKHNKQSFKNLEYIRSLGYDVTEFKDYNAKTIQVIVDIQKYIYNHINSPKGIDIDALFYKFTKHLSQEERQIVAQKLANSSRYTKTPTKEYRYFIENFSGQSRSYSKLFEGKNIAEVEQEFIDAINNIQYKKEYDELMRIFKQYKVETSVFTNEFTDIIYNIEEAFHWKKDLFYRSEY